MGSLSTLGGMPSQVFSATEVKRLLKEGAQLVDVLGQDEFEHDHLPGAINIPLKQLDGRTADQLDRTRPVLVYCNDFG
jgi:rhodanese-related sulfurtransferase